MDSAPQSQLRGPSPSLDDIAFEPRRRVPLWLVPALNTPLLGKLVVADLLINIVAYIMVRNANPNYVNEIMVVALATTLALNAMLVYFALLPLKTLEVTAVKVSSGDLAARVPKTIIADRNIARIGETLNTLLDGVLADRERMRALASQVIIAGDQERAHIARELHDSTAQALSALDLLLTASLRHGEAMPPERLRLMLDIVGETLQEVRTLSHNVHPRVLDDLGLVAALEWLLQRTRTGGMIDTEIVSDVDSAIPQAVGSVLFRIAQEAVGNAIRHANPTKIVILISATGTNITLEVTDNGRGFDPATVEASRTGMGLFIIRERVALVDGALDISTVLGAGTTLRARVPLHQSTPQSVATKHA